jgi:3-dehydroquinate synthase
MEITVTLGARSYPIVLGSGIAAALPARLRTDFPNSMFGLVTNTTLSALYTPLIARWADELDLTIHCMPDGELYKTVETWSAIFDTFIPAKLERSSVIIALGGGVVGDVAGFAAATYMRGIACVQVPTTLLAMVDSSVGGKTAVDHPAGKNLIGAFHQPTLVWIDTAFLDTLPEREYAAGCAELIKYAFIGGPELFDYFAHHGPTLLTHRRKDLLPDAIFRAASVKAGVVARDETETRGERALLNFGHTFAHALEKYFGFGKLLHGEAVWLGMRCAVELGKLLTAIPEETLPHYETMLHIFPRPELDMVPDPADIIEAMRFDKKVSAGTLNIVVPAAPGFSIVKQGVPEETVKAAIAAGLNS